MLYPGRGRDEAGQSLAGFKLCPVATHHSNPLGETWSSNDAGDGEIMQDHPDSFVFSRERTRRWGPGVLIAVNQGISRSR